MVCGIFSRRIGNSNVEIVEGDITKQDTDAIVNAANSSLGGGGGVDGAIHRAGGPSIVDQCQRYVARHGKLAAGAAMYTSAGKLAASYVIHTVGPIYRNDRISEPILQNAYTESLKLAEEIGAESISFPSISTGAYRYPLGLAASVAIGAIFDYLQGGSQVVLVRIVCFTKDVFVAYVNAAKNLA